MRVVALLLLFVLAVSIALNRERIYVRDPIASVYRSQVKQSGVEIYINFSNDIILQQNYPDRPPQRTIVQHWDKIPGTPIGLMCLRWMACFTPADHAPLLPADAGAKNARDPKVTMDGRRITFIGPAGEQINVDL
jgi:hypothetical protein